MMKRLLLTALFAVASSGCYTMNASLPGTLRDDIDPKETQKVGTASVEDTEYYLFWGLVGTPDERLFADSLQKQVAAKGGDGLSNVTYESSFGCLNLIVGNLTCGIVAPRDYKVSGDIVRITKAPLPGKPPKAPAAPAAKAAPKTAQAY